MNTNSPPPTPPTPFVWQGRIDTEEPGPTTRWHQHVTPFTAATQGGIALLGFAVDAGVQRNGGRPGAALGPSAIRTALANLPIHNEPAISDAGDVVCVGDALEAAQTELAQRVAQARAQRAFPLVLGGGHEVAWGTFQGLVQSGVFNAHGNHGINGINSKHSPHGPKTRLLIVNLDAHFDLRTAARANSGTPFRQIQTWCAANDQPFNYRVLGISRFANTQALFDCADTLGVRYWLDEQLQTEADFQAALAALTQDLQTCDAIYLTVCLDMLPAPLAPGVSAPAVLGVPLSYVERVIDHLTASGRVIAADIAEMNPTLDRDGITARVAARIAARLVGGGGRGAGKTSVSSSQHFADTVTTKD